MHFLHILYYTWENGGPSKVVYDLAQQQIKDGHKVTILTIRLKSHSDYHKIEGVEMIYADAHFLTNIFPLFSFKIWEELKNNHTKYNVIHLHLLWNFTLLAAHLLKLHNKVVITIHGSAHPYTFKGSVIKRGLFSVLFQKAFLKKVKLIHLLHDGEKLEIEKYLKISFSNFCIIPNGIDLPKHQYSSKKENLDILFLGRLHQKKGLDILLPAFLEVLRILPEARLILAGPDYGMLAFVEKFIANNSLGENIAYLGPISGNIKEDYLRNSKVFVLPSYSEGFSIAVLEALSYKLPVVVSTETGLSKEIINYDAGEIVDFSLRSISKAIISILIDNDLAEKYSNNGYKLVKEKFETNLVVNKFVKILRTYFDS